MGTKIYVGGLPFSTSDSELSELFSKYGTVTSANVITDKFSGQSRGFAFVEMASSEEVAKAISALNGSTLGSRTLIVNEAKPQEKRERSGGSRW